MFNERLERFIFVPVQHLHLATTGRFDTDVSYALFVKKVVHTGHQYEYLFVSTP